MGERVFRLFCPEDAADADAPADFVPDVGDGAALFFGDGVTS